MEVIGTSRHDNNLQAALPRSVSAWAQHPCGLSSYRQCSEMQSLLECASDCMPPGHGVGVVMQIVIMWIFSQVKLGNQQCADSWRSWIADADLPCWDCRCLVFKQGQHSGRGLETEASSCCELLTQVKAGSIQLEDSMDRMEAVRKRCST